MAIPISKVCKKCGKTKKLATNFYTSREFHQEYDRDLWCKECVQKLVKTKETMQQYCNGNFRVFSDVLWETAMNAMSEKLKNDIEYNSLKEKERESYFNQRVVNTYFSRMNQTQYYKLVDVDIEKIIKNDNQDMEEEDFDDEPVKRKKEKKIYSEKWGGTFSTSDLQWLEEQFIKMNNDYELKTEIDLQYASNVAISGLIVRKMREEYLNGVTGADKRYKDAIATYDSLCTSAKFNQKTRTENAASGLGSFGETWKMLEEMGFAPVKVTFPKDDVDKILEEYAHSHIALRGALDDDGES